MDIVMQRMTITNVEADMDRLIKVIFAFIYLLHYALYVLHIKVIFWSPVHFCCMIVVFNNVTVQQ